MSADIVSLSEFGRMPWQSPLFTKPEKTILHGLAYEGMASMAVRDYVFEKIDAWHVMNMVCGEWEGAPKITFSKGVLENKITYDYAREGGDRLMTGDFMRAVEFARTDLREFGATARIELERDTSNRVANSRRATFALVKK